MHHWHAPTTNKITLQSQQFMSSSIFKGHLIGGKVPIVSWTEGGYDSLFMSLIGVITVKIKVCRGTRKCLLVGCLCVLTCVKSLLYTSDLNPFLTVKELTSAFLAHLSTTCSRGAFRVVMCPSCFVNNFFKHLLLPNRWASLDQTWQECSFGGPLKK